MATNIVVRGLETLVLIFIFFNSKLVAKIF